MRMIPPVVLNDEHRLCHLAMDYRRTRDPQERKQVAIEYAKVVDRLIASGAWTETPPQEDLLPEEDMPPTFWPYWAKEAERIAKEAPIQFEPAAVVSFPDRETEKRAIGKLIGRFSGRIERSGRHTLPADAIEFLRQVGLPFTVLEELSNRNGSPDFKA